jgi:hypothetical protein
MTGTFRITVTAPSSADATDIAKRRARDDGWTVKTVRTCKQDALGRWAVVLAVSK